MTNREIAALLFNISTLLAAQHENPYRIRAYRRAARNILRARHSIVERARNEQPLGIPFLGERLTRTITRLALDGTCDVYEELVGELPTAQQRLLHVPGIGPRLAERIARDLKVDDAEDLIQRAARVGLQRVWGIGPKRAQLIVKQLHTSAEQATEQSFVRDGNVIYVQESFWNAERKNAA
jgi:DNA polymerase (family 10)